MNKNNIFKPIALSALMLIIIELLGSVIAIVLLKMIPNIPTVVIGFFSIILTYIIVIFTFYYHHSKFKGLILDFIKDIKIKKVSFKLLVKMLFCGGCIYLISILLQDFVFYQLLPHTKDIITNTTKALTSNNLGYWTILVTYIIPIIISPIFEESIFRGLIGNFYRIFEPDGHPIAFLITESLCFGLLHLQVSGGIYLIVTSFAIPMITGFLFGLIYLKQKNLTCTIITHSTFNIIVTILSKI